MNLTHGTGWTAYLLAGKPSREGAITTIIELFTEKHGRRPVVILATPERVTPVAGVIVRVANPSCEPASSSGMYFAQ